MRKYYMPVGAVMGIVGTILMLFGMIFGDAFPDFLWLVTVVCCLTNSVCQILNYRYLKKQQGKSDAAEQQNR